MGGELFVESCALCWSDGVWPYSIQYTTTVYRLHCRFRGEFLGSSTSTHAPHSAVQQCKPVQAQNCSSAARDCAYPRTSNRHPHIAPGVVRDDDGRRDDHRSKLTRHLLIILCTSHSPFIHTTRPRGSRRGVLLLDCIHTKHPGVAHCFPLACAMPRPGWSQIRWSASRAAALGETRPALLCLRRSAHRLL